MRPRAPAAQIPSIRRIERIHRQSLLEVSASVLPGASFQSNAPQLEKGMSEVRSTAQGQLEIALSGRGITQSLVGQAPVEDDQAIDRIDCQGPFIGLERSLKVPL